MLRCNPTVAFLMDYYNPKLSLLSPLISLSQPSLSKRRTKNLLNQEEEKDKDYGFFSSPLSLPVIKDKNPTGNHYFLAIWGALGSSSLKKKKRVSGNETKRKRKNEKKKKEMYVWDFLSNYSRDLFVFPGYVLGFASSMAPVNAPITGDNRKTIAC